MSPTAIASRPVVPGCAGCAMAHPIFRRSVNPISTRGDRLWPPNYYWHIQIFRPSDGPGISYHLTRGSKYIYIPKFSGLCTRTNQSHLAVFCINRNAIGCYDFIRMLCTKKDSEMDYPTFTGQYFLVLLNSCKLVLWLRHYTVNLHPNWAC